MLMKTWVFINNGEFLSKYATHLLKFNDNINVCIIGQIEVKLFEDLRRNIFDKFDIDRFCKMYVSCTKYL
jgi:hypothetical protein